MLPLLLSLHLEMPSPQAPALQPPRLVLATFEAPSLGQVVNLQLPQPAAPRLDPYKGSLRLGEVGVGAGTSLLATAAAVGLGLALVATIDPNRPDDIPFGFLVGSLTWLALQVLAVPPLVALVEYAFSDAPLAGSLGRAVGYAYGGQGIAVVVVLLAELVAHANNDAGTAVGVLGVLGVELVGIPILASLGLHGGNNAPGPGEVQPAAAPPPAEAPPPQLAPPPQVPGSVPTLPPLSLQLGFRF